MTDLRELLREARVELAMYRADCPAVEEEFVDGVDPVAALIARIDAALAQPPDAEPVACRYRYSENGRWFLCAVPGPHEFTPDDEVELQMLYAAPQPPAGKGEQ